MTPQHPKYRTYRLGARVKFSLKGLGTGATTWRGKPMAERRGVVVALSRDGSCAKVHWNDNKTASLGMYRYDMLAPADD